MVQDVGPCRPGGRVGGGIQEQGDIGEAKPGPQAVFQAEGIIDAATQGGGGAGIVAADEEGALAAGVCSFVF